MLPNMLTFIKHLNVISRQIKTHSLSYSSLTNVEKCESITKLKQTHTQIIIHGLHHDPITISKLISFCALSKTADLRYALHLFDQTPQRNRHMYNSLVRGYVNDGNLIQGLELYKEMIWCGVEPNEFTYPFVLKACAALCGLLDGVLVHVRVVKMGFEKNVYVQNGLISLYCGCGEIGCSRKVFGDMGDKSLVTWNTMIGGYSKMGGYKEAFLLFKEMREVGEEPDDFTFVSLFSVCSQKGLEVLGRLLHSYIVTSKTRIDIYVQNAIVDMYAKCGHLETAQTFFDRMSDKNVVSWTSMVSAYAKYGLVESAKDFFYRMPLKNVVSWNSMISCYLQKGLCSEALGLYTDMFNTGLTPDETTLASVLSACCQLGDLETGKNVHSYIFSKYVTPTVTLFNSLIDMYAKYGSLETSLTIFSEMPEKNLVSWNVMIGGLALHGCGIETVKVFDSMQASGTQPDAITFTGLLSACCHSGLVDIGKYYFDQMTSVYKVPHDIEHYACMVDLFGRVGQFGEAVKLINGMPMKPDVVVWGSLLGACRIHGNIEIGKQVLKQVLELEPYTSGIYVLVSNLFSEAKRWQDVKNIRKLMKDQGIKKSSGVSSVEVNGHVYEFMVDDQKNELSSDVYELLDRLTDNLKALGCEDGEMGYHLLAVE